MRMFIKRPRQKLRLPGLSKVRTDSQRQLADTQDWSDHLLWGGVSDNARLNEATNKKPLLLIAVAGACLFLLLLFQLVNLQITKGSAYRSIADGNRVRESVDLAPRGRILDRNGVVLAENTASFQLSATPYLLPDSSDERYRIYNRIAELSDTDADTIKMLAEEEGLAHTQPIPVLERMDRDVALRLEVELSDLKGFDLNSMPIRRYENEAGLAHILGYVGRVNPEELERRDRLHPLDFTGKTGVEERYDDELRGQNGITEVEVDSRRRPLRTLRNVPTEQGQDIRLTIDYELQRRLAKALSEQMEEAGVSEASAVVTDPVSGEVLAMVSLPGYDNNLFAAGIEDADYERLVSDDKEPMLNRAISGAFASGSVIKPFGLIGALGTGTVEEDTIIHDRGELTLYSQYDSTGFTFRGWDPSGLGPMDARRAIAMSSNIYFYTVAGGYQDFEGMGVDKLVQYYRMFGLGERTGIDLPNETPGRVPTPEWKQDTKGEQWFIGDTYNLAIGQGDLLVSPMQMARAYGAIANGGKLVRPYISTTQEDSEIQDRLDIPSRDLQVLREGMRMVVDGNGTTSPATFADVDVPVAGKSGTAETDPGSRDANAWYAAYAPYEDAELAAVVILEEGEGGSQYGAPVIADVFEWYFK